MGKILETDDVFNRGFKRGSFEHSMSAYGESVNANQYRFVMEFDGVCRLLWILDPVYAYMRVRDSAFLSRVFFQDGFCEFVYLLFVGSIGFLPVSLAWAICLKSVLCWFGLGLDVFFLVFGILYSYVSDTLHDTKHKLAGVRPQRADGVPRRKRKSRHD